MLMQYACAKGTVSPPPHTHTPPPLIYPLRLLGVLHTPGWWRRGRLLLLLPCTLSCPRERLLLLLRPYAVRCPCTGGHGPAPLPGTGGVTRPRRPPTAGLLPPCATAAAPCWPAGLTPNLHQLLLCPAGWARARGGKWQEVRSEWRWCVACDAGRGGGQAVCVACGRLFCLSWQLS